MQRSRWPDTAQRSRSLSEEQNAGTVLAAWVVKPKFNSVEAKLAQISQEFISLEPVRRLGRPPAESTPCESVKITTRVKDVLLSLHLPGLHRKVEKSADLGLVQTT